MGPFQALAWAMHFLEMMRSAVLMVPASRAIKVRRSQTEGSSHLKYRLDYPNFQFHSVSSGRLQWYRFGELH